MALTKKQEQEARAAAAEEARIQKLTEQLAAAQAKQAERAEKQKDEVRAQIERRLKLIVSKHEAIDRMTEEIAKYREEVQSLAETIGEEAPSEDSVTFNKE